MELIEKERKQREQVGAALIPSIKFLLFLSNSHFLCHPQMFLLKADQLKRYEKEKVGGKLLLFLLFYASGAVFIKLGCTKTCSC